MTNQICGDAVEKFFHKYGGVSDSKRFIVLADLFDRSGLDITDVKLNRDSGRSDSYTGMKITVSAMVSFIFLPGTQMTTVIYRDRDTNEERERFKVPLTDCVEFVKQEVAKGIDIQRDVSWPYVSDGGMGFDLFG